MTATPDISRRRFTAAALVALVAAGTTSWSTLGTRPFRSVADVAMDDVRRGRPPRGAYAPRLDALEGRTIAFVSNGSYEEARSFAFLREALQRKYHCSVIDRDAFPIGRGVLAKENNGVAETMAGLGADAAILGNAGCSQCSISLGRAAAQLELAGIPTVLVADRAFQRQLAFAFQSFGLPSQPTVSCYLPAELFDADGSIAALRDNLPAFLAALTSLDFALRPADMDIIL